MNAYGRSALIVEAKPSSLRSDKLWLALVWMGVLVGLLYCYLIDPANSSLGLPCPFHAATGLHCPGCGSTRALHQLVHGNLAGAFAYNPLAVLVFPYLVYSLLSYSSAVLRRKPLPGYLAPAWQIWAFLAVVLLYWVLRNVPVYPFSWLAPG